MGNRGLRHFISGCALTLLGGAAHALNHHNISEEIREPLAGDITTLFMIGFAILGACCLLHQIRK